MQAATLRMAAAGVAAAVAAGCTSTPDEPRTVADRSGGELRLGGIQPDVPAFEGDSALGAALASVPPSVLYASFTDLTAVKERLGYAGVDSSSPAAERFAFWEAARAGGTMLTGTRLYDDISLMADDYGWTADDVAWEIDFSGNETGCTEDMLCDPSGGAVLGFRPGLDTRVVVGSLADNGFEFDGASQFWTTERPGQPFTQAVYLPTLNAIALGNAIGLIRVRDVAAGAPSLADQIPSLVAEVDRRSPESVYVDTTGCVSLGEALGPDATDDDVARFFKANDPARLADADAWAVVIDSEALATSYLVFAGNGSSPSRGDEAARRAAILHGWDSAQAGVAFDDVASAHVTVDGSIERARFDVAAMPTFAAMVLTHDAPWALCPTQPPA